MTTDPPQYMTTQGMADHLGVSLSKLKELVSTGAIPDTAFFRHQRTYRFNVARVEAALLDGANPKEGKPDE